MTSDRIYEQVLNLVSNDFSDTILFLDVEWGNYQVEDKNLLSFQPVRDAHNTLPQSDENRKFLGAYNLACEFLRKGRNRWLVCSSRIGLPFFIKEYMKRYPHLRIEDDGSTKIIKSNNNRIVSESSSIKDATATIKIIEFLLKKEYELSTPMVKLKSTATNQDWFSFSNQAVPHDFPEELDEQTNVRIFINKIIEFPSPYYTVFTHEGIKNYCLNRKFCCNVLYASLIFAIFKNQYSPDEFIPPPSNPDFYDDINPDNWRDESTDNINILVVYVFNFFRVFYKKWTPVCLSTTSNSLTLTSSEPMQKLSSKVTTHIRSYQEDEYWGKEHTTSLYLAKFIVEGGHGLVNFEGTKVISYNGQGFNITMKDKQLIFSWRCILFTEDKNLDSVSS